MNRIQPATGTEPATSDDTATEDAWFLTPQERGNPATTIDRRRGDGRAWTAGNQVVPLIHGRTYFAELLGCLRAMRAGDVLMFTDWRGDGDERLGDGPGTELATVLADLARADVDVRGLVWRSHEGSGRFSEHEHIELAERVNDAGGEILLDERVRRSGCHHQKLVLLRSPTAQGPEVAFVGGIDLCHGRRDDERHLGDPQPIALDERFGQRPAWHDAQIRLAGPAIGDLTLTFRERWEDPTPLDHRGPIASRIRRVAREPRRASPLAATFEEPDPVGSHSVQVLRTYPKKRPPYPFAPEGERSIARAYQKVLGRARSSIYIEDQYLWSDEVADLLASSLRRAPELRLIAVIPRYPDQDGVVSGPPNRIGRQRALDRVFGAGGDRVAAYDLENERGDPIYVHAKVFIVDDVWAAVGSDNLNRRSWTHDSEVSCAVIDRERDDREPRDPGGLGDGARVFARELRLRLWREHLGPETPERVLLDPVAGFDAWTRSARALDGWHAGGRIGQRPSGRARPHRSDRVAPMVAWWAMPLYRTLIDPDGRPGPMKRRERF
jgi:phosphatidylserine/phosphatidylglycerophosphate/cardiolipin synthase-like enzyme